MKRVNLLSVPTFLVQVRRDALPAVRTAVESAGATACTLAALETARVESGTPVFGQDITADNLPQEIGRDAVAISFTKGCYLGQETVARIDALGHVNRQLAGVRFAGATIPAPDTKLFAGDKEVGQVKSAVWSQKLGGPLAIALVRRAQTKAGTALTSDAGEATIVALPV